MSLSTFISDTLDKLSGRGATDPITRDSKFPDVSDAPLDSRRLIRDRRYSHVLLESGELEFDEVSIACAWKALHHEMAYVPGGAVRLMEETVTPQGNAYGLSVYASDPVPVEALYLDRDCVTNADYARFVKAGGYDDPQLWPQDTLPWVLQFVDRTNNAGPRFWCDGSPPADRLDHPVVGICWYEASAYARWVGKRLPTSAEWQRAGTWPKSHTGTGSEQRYPWGNAFEGSRANLWQSNRSSTIPVDALPDGDTPNGVRQLIGNVWEWLDAGYSPACEGEARVLLEDTLAEIRGGAHDTYFASQATCQFRSGLPIMSRPANVGFRCCLTTDILHPQDLTRAEETE